MDITKSDYLLIGGTKGGGTGGAVEAFGAGDEVVGVVVGAGILSVGSGMSIVWA
jgi:hypothetical protein